MYVKESLSIWNRKNFGKYTMLGICQIIVHNMELQIAIKLH